MTDFFATESYYKRRDGNLRDERNLREPMEKIYAVHGLRPEYNVVKAGSPARREPEGRIVSEKEKRGLDVTLTLDGRKIYVDEKAFNSRMDAFATADTFAFEVTSQNNKGATGWLYKEKPLNTHLALIYPRYRPCGGPEGKKLEGAEVIIIKTEKIHEYLKSSGYGSAKSITEKIDRNGELYDGGRKIGDRINRDLKFVRSIGLEESPENAVISRGLLREMAEKDIYVRDIEKEIMPKYNEMVLKRQEEEKRKLPEKDRIEKCIYFNSASGEMLKKAAKSIKKLSRAALPEHVVIQSDCREEDILPSKRINVAVTGYAAVGGGIVLKTSPGKEARDKIYIACGKSGKRLNYDKINFTDLGMKNQFLLSCSIGYRMNGEQVKEGAGAGKTDKDQPLATRQPWRLAAGR